MQQLLQDLWDQFCVMVKKIDDLTDDCPINQEPFKSLSELVGDTDEMVQLRKRLYSAGVKGIAGFYYNEKGDKL
uniref:Uncharacterized protein n=1 Tax=viral metagenome TaxID=1070528 RepID=A0A6H2A5A0_9ZZZZ